MAAEKKTKETETTKPEVVEKKAIIMVSTALCPIVLSPSQIIKPGDEFEATDAQIESKAFRHLFVTGGLQFKDDAARTAEYQDKARQGVKVDSEPATIAEAEGKENKEY